MRKCFRFFFFRFRVVAVLTLLCIDVVGRKLMLVTPGT